MGLDMYLNKHYFVSNDTDAVDNVLRDTKVGNLPIKEIVCEAMYWRKANWIHQWFVDEVQEGNDDCRQYSVSIEQLKLLYKEICEVIRTQDSSLLPPQAGFFFGSTEVDEHYWEYMEYTKETLKQLIEDHSKENPRIYSWFTYQSSW